MSKYIKLEDAEKLLTNALRIAQGFDEPLERALVDLPTIEVSEDMVSRKDFEDVIRRMGERNCFTCGVYHEGEWTLMARNPEKVTAEELEESDRAVSLAEVCKIIQDTYEVCPATWGRLRNLPSVVPTIEVMEYPQVEGITPTLVTPEVSEGVIAQGSGDFDLQAVTSTGQEIYAKGYEDGKAECDNCIWDICNYNTLDWEVSEDCISREWIISFIDAGHLRNPNEKCYSENDVVELIKGAPSVVPSGTKGEWIMHIDDLFPCESTQECSVCHSQHLICGNDDNYCPYCGAYMKG